MRWYTERIVQRFNTASILAAVWLLTATAALSGCKAYPPPPVASNTPFAVQPATTSIAADSRPVIACFGDSITAGLGVDPTVNYPADLQHELDTRGYRYRVANLGVSGETTKDGLERVSQVLARKPDLVIVEFGGNDGLRGLPAEESQKNLLGIVSALRRGGTKVLLVAITLPKQYGPDYISRFEAIYPTIAKQANVPLLGFAQFSKGMFAEPSNVQDDGIHPTAAGDAIIAKNVANNLVPMLKR
jgi:acyl-CoA thioesterase-1